MVTALYGRYRIVAYIVHVFIWRGLAVVPSPMSMLCTVHYMHYTTSIGSPNGPIYIFLAPLPWWAT